MLLLLLLILKIIYRFRFSFAGKDAVINKVPEHSKVEHLIYGLAVNIILKEYSTFYRYELQAVVRDNRTTLLDVLPSGILRLKEEIEGTKELINIIFNIHFMYLLFYTSRIIKYINFSYNYFKIFFL